MFVTLKVPQAAAALAIDGPAGNIVRPTTLATASNAVERDLFTFPSTIVCFNGRGMTSPREKRKITLTQAVIKTTNGPGLLHSHQLHLR
ncbi:hypothetical protein GCM10027456_63190 [Kineosporia babensis]